MENRETLLLQRYFRKTIAHPEGSIVHKADCDFFNIKICTCGLHSDLLPMNETFLADRYPLFDLERAEYEKVREGLMGHKPKRKKRKS